MVIVHNGHDQQRKLLENFSTSTNKKSEESEQT